MLVRDTLSRVIKPLRAIDTAREALSAMMESGQVVLPVVDQTTNRFIGMVSRDSAEKHHMTVDSVLTIREQNSIVTDPYQNILDTVRVMEKHDLSLLPVLENGRNYVGVVERKKLNEQVIQMLNLTEYGSLVTVHFEERDFTLSKLVRIIESEGGLILGMSVESPRDDSPLYVVSLKLNVPDPVRIVAALKRHEYVVDAHSTDYEEDRRYEQRADELMHYLNL